MKPIIPESSDDPHIVTKAKIALLKEIRETAPEAFKRLQEKAQWEHMSLYAVLREWG